MDFFAHKTENGKLQTVKEHSQNVSRMASEFAIEMFRSAAAAIGMAHDIGKYAAKFQDRLNGKKVVYEHSVCGAIELDKMKSDPLDAFLFPMLEYCVAGHHTGLPDGGNDANNEDDATLYGKLSRKSRHTDRSDYSGYQDQIQLEKPDMKQIGQEFAAFGRDEWDAAMELYAFFTRYLFSCLTDADFLDTEHFCYPEISREMKADFREAMHRLELKLSGFSAITPLQAARSRLQKQAFVNAQKEGDVHILQMPTGSGKTLCSLKIALQKLLDERGGKKRIIYVIPYTSIIEQTAETFSEVLGDCVQLLQHHSNYCFESESENQTTAEKQKRAAENWDAPLVITTSVQFFQSLYHYRSSGLRKLHNLEDSLIVFDEIHMLPVAHLQPCLRAIGYLTKYLNSEVVFLSATMPEYRELFQRYMPDAKINTLITDTSDNQYFQKCRYVFLRETDVEHVIFKAQAFRSSLIVVNKRRTAREIYAALSGKKYHLSTCMTPVDRSETIRKIREDLKQGNPITVVSTSLIEAGVDLDFEAVFRQLAGLDSILQSGGRCNRDGKRESGTVYVFETDEKPHGEMKVRASIARSLFEKYSDITSLECMKEYYTRLFEFQDEAIIADSIARFGCEKNGCILPDSIPFRSYAKQFQFIKDDTIGVVINQYDESAVLLEQLKKGDTSARRKLQKYMVGLRAGKEQHSEWYQAYQLGLLMECDGVYVLADNHYYNKETGLNLEYQPDPFVE